MINKNQEQVNVIGFIPLGTEPTDIPIPKDYLSESPLPKKIIEEMKEVGWMTEDGKIDFPHDYQPPPMRGKDGKVYLNLNKNSMEDQECMMSLMSFGMEMIERGCDYDVLLKEMGVYYE